MKKKLCSIVCLCYFVSIMLCACGRKERVFMHCECMFIGSFSVGTQFRKGSKILTFTFFRLLIISQNCFINFPLSATLSHVVLHVPSLFSATPRIMTPP